MLKLDFSLFEQTPHLGLVRTWDGVCLNSVGCTRYFMGLVLTVELAHFICCLFEQTPPGRILKNSIFRTNIIEGNLICTKDY